MIILLVLLILPGITLADQVEDISESEQKVQSADEGIAKNSDTPSPSAWKRVLGFVGLSGRSPAAINDQQNVAQPSDSKASEKQDPLVTPEKTTVENVVRHQAITADTTPVITSKTPDTKKSSKWQGFLSVLGLHDERQSIPPVEVASTNLHLGQDYIIGPGDLLGISVWRDDSLTRSVVVLPDGKIQFPLIGEIVAGGKSVAQLKKEFVEKLSSYVVDADISVEVKQSNSLFIYIIGKVNSPGRQMLLADTTVLQALAMAGGLNPFAEKNDIKIFRQESERTLVYSFRYTQVVTGNFLDDNLLLKRGDVIVVP
jgi:polysaccharide export outer membrane protein